MATKIPARFHETGASSQPIGPVHLFVLAVGVSALTAAYAGRAISPDALFPAVSGTLLVAAALLAALGWRQRKAKLAFVTYWDVSGALTLIGICAAALVDPEDMVRLMAHQRTP